MNAQIKQLPTTTNISNLNEEELIKLANKHYQGVTDAMLQAVWEVKYCGDALRELQQRYTGKKTGQGVKGGFQDLFVCENHSHTKLKMSNWQAYKYINVSPSTCGTI